MAYTHHLLGREDEAIQGYKTAIALQPNMGLLYYNLAISYQATGRYQDALNALESALAKGYPGDPKFRRWLVRACQKVD